MDLVDPFTELLRFAVRIVHPRLDISGVVINANVVGSDCVEQLEIVFGRDPVFQRHHDACFFGVAGHLLHHRDEGADLLFVLHVDVAVAKNREQDVGRADIACHLHRLDQQYRRRWIRMQRQTRLSWRANRQRTDLNAVFQRCLFELRLNFRIAQGRRVVGGIRDTDLDAVEADLARECDLRDVAAFTEIPIGHPDPERNRSRGLCLLSGASWGGSEEGRAEGCLFHQLATG